MTAIGAIHPAAKVSLWAEEWTPAWFALIVPYHWENTAAQWLADNGAPESWYPSETIYIRNIYRPNRRTPQIKPIVPGLLFASFARRPIWDFLFARSGKRITNVIRIGDRPAALRDADMMQMKQVPERLAGMRSAAIEAATIRPGDTVTITEGQMAGWSVTIDAVDSGLARFTTPLGPASVNVERVAK